MGRWGGSGPGGVSSFGGALNSSSGGVYHSAVGSDDELRLWYQVWFPNYS